MQHRRIQSGQWSECLLHVPARLFELPSRDDFEQLEICIRHVWRRLRGGETDGIDHILIFAHESRETCLSVELLKQQLLGEGIALDLQTWLHVNSLVENVKSSGRVIHEDDIKDVVANPDAGFREMFMAFFCLPE